MHRSYLKSPIVELVVGPSSDATHLFAHEALLAKSPYFADIVAALGNEVRLCLIMKSYTSFPTK
jgi:hypothetical protein